MIASRTPTSRAACALAVLAAIACAHSKVVDQHLELHEQDVAGGAQHLEATSDQHAQLEEHEFVTEGPRKEEGRWFGPDGGVVFEGSRTWQGGTDETWHSSQEFATAHVDETAAQTSAKKLDVVAAAHVDERTRVGPRFPWLWIAGALAVLAAAAAAAWKLKPPWLAAAWRLIAR